MTRPTTGKQPTTAAVTAGGLVSASIRRAVSTSRRIALVMGLEAGSLAVMASLHLSGILDGGANEHTPNRAGIAEAIICVVLCYGAVVLMRAPSRGRRAALVSTGFAFLGFIVGLSSTIPDGQTIDIAYHVTVLPLLLLTLVALRRTSANGSGT